MADCWILGRLLDRLEEKGWVQRRADPTDRRAKKVYLTDKVEPTMRIMREQAGAANAEALGSLDRSEQKTVVELLKRVRGDLADLYAPGGKTSDD